MLTAAEKRAIWMRCYEENKDFIENELPKEIEKNRKSFCKLRFVREDGTPLVGQRITVRQNKHDFKYGANIFLLDEFQEEKDNAAYRDLFAKYFNLATVPFYWDGLEPTEGKPRFDRKSEKVYRRPAPDLCVEYCEEHDINAKLHCLVYDKFTPDWLPKDDMAKMEAFYEQRIRQIADRYRGRLLEFEVTNELLEEAKWTTQTVISQKRDILEWAFALARKYLPNETLVINEGNPLPFTALQDYRHPYFMQIENALLKGVSIDKIGLQHHIFTGVRAATEQAYEESVKNLASIIVDPRKIWNALNIYAEFGLPLELTEVTVPTFGDTPEDERLQADLLRMLYTVWFAHPAVNTVVYWNTVDGYAYDGGAEWNENRCRGGLFHHDLTPKKSADTLYELFQREWHTEFTAETDENGYVEFRGFYGEYTAEAEGTIRTFGLHRDGSPVTEIEL